MIYLIKNVSSLILVMIVMACVVSSSPPGNPIKCLSANNTNCIITNSYGEFADRTICKASNVVYPTTEDELISDVAMATKNKIKVKVTTRYSHSITKLVCPDGQDGTLISTLYLNRIVNIDMTTRLMTVQSGVTLRQVIEQAAQVGLALEHGPYWWGLTVGGLISTGAHGSGWRGTGSSVHDYIERIRIVTPAGEDEGFAKVRELDNNDPDINAAKVSLGVLGVISQVTLRLVPLFKRSITFQEKNDFDLAIKATTFGNEHEFADITWYPNQRKAIYRLDDRVSTNVFGDGVNDFIGFRSTPSLVLAVIRSSEETQELLRNADGKCVAAMAATTALSTAGFGYSNNGILFTKYPIVGFQNRLQSAGSCLDSPQDSLITACGWDDRVKGVFFHQTAISIGISNVKNFIEDVQKLRDLEPKAFCTMELQNGILLRYVKASNAYLGKQEDGVDFDITYYRSKNPQTPRLFEDIFEEVEQIGVFKYGGLPHWGKNRNLAFEGAIGKYRDASKFLKVKEKYDPFGVFSSEWTDQILGLKGKVSIVKEGCALEGLCICSEDKHCAPQSGYLCRPGRVYKDARVCTFISSSIQLGV